jgi:hypothetical protein
MLLVFLRRPTLKLAVHRPRLQGHANAIAALQPREGLPVVPILPLSRSDKSTEEHELKEEPQGSLRRFDP